MLTVRLPPGNMIHCTRQIIQIRTTYICPEMSAVDHEVEVDHLLDVEHRQREKFGLESTTLTRAVVGI